MPSDIDILDAPQAPKPSQNRSFFLLYIELGFIVFWTVLEFWKHSIRNAPILIFFILIYCCIAPFLKPQFTKSKSLRNSLGYWNIFQIILLGIAIFFIIESFPNVSQPLTISLLSLASYYLVLPFVESHKLKSLRFLSVLFFGLGFSILFLGLAFQLNSWSYALYLVAIGSILVGIAALMMLFQLIKAPKLHIYYWFYLPRVIGLLLVWATTLFRG